MRRTIYIYADSTAFPRSLSVRPEDSWPMKITQKQDLMYLRGFGGATSSELVSLMERDSIYFGFREDRSECEDIVIFCAGIVDVAPRPITYKLKVLTKIPVFGPKIWIAIGMLLRRHRVLIQRIARYKLVSYRQYRKNLKKITKIITNKNIRILITETPIPSGYVLNRSPYFKSNVEKLNQLKLQETEWNPRLEFIRLEIDEERQYVSREDGHHFSAKGHEVVSEQILRHINH
ncbi:SGNH_hydrolase domain containing protein [Candidatus Nanopelagicaceae bacterium]